jgi:NitT/TauT family transport system ATP-binding protein
MLEYQNISKTFALNGVERTVLSKLNLRVDSGEFVAIAGPSGCGKSTLLRLTAGLEVPDEGAVRVGSRKLSASSDIKLGFVFQEAALLPWRTLADNVALGLETRGVPKDERRSKAVALLRTFGLQGFEDYYPHMVSGGMKARASIARAYIIDPMLLLMDEPFVALDAQTREALQRELWQHWQTSKKTVLFVTHSLEEALLLGTRVIVLGRPPSTVMADYAIGPEFPRDPSKGAFIDMKRMLRAQIH